MEIDLLAFGIAKEIIGSAKLRLTLDEENSVGRLKELLAQKYPGLLELDHYFIAKNEEYADDKEMISENDELVLIPPVSGG